MFKISAGSVPSCAWHTQQVQWLLVICTRLTVLELRYFRKTHQSFMKRNCRKNTFGWVVRSKCISPCFGCEKCWEQLVEKTASLKMRKHFQIDSVSAMVPGYHEFVWWNSSTLLLCKYIKFDIYATSVDICCFRRHHPQKLVMSSLSNLAHILKWNIYGWSTVCLPYIRCVHTYLYVYYPILDNRINIHNYINVYKYIYISRINDIFCI